MILRTPRKRDFLCDMERRNAKLSSTQFQEWQTQLRQENRDDSNLERKIRMGNLFAQMSRFPTVSRLENGRRDAEYYLASDGFAQFINEYVQKMGEEIGYTFTINQIVEDNGVKSMVVSTHPGKEADFAIINHYDVVPPYYPTDFCGEEITGRGVADMRGSIIVGLEALRKVGQEAVEGTSIPHVALWLTGDEETGGDFGTKALVQNGYRANTVINLDGPSNGEFFIRSKGIQKLLVTMKGLSAHGSRPWLGFDPSEVLLSAFGNNFERSLHEGWEDTGTTMTIVRINAGQAENSSPLEATVSLDCRFSNPEEGKNIVEIARQKVRSEFNRRIGLIQARVAELERDNSQRVLLEEMLQNLQGLENSISITEGNHSDVFLIDENDSEVQRWLAITEDVMQKSPRKVIAMGGNDSEYTVGVAQHQILSAIPTAEGAHSPNERIFLPGMVQMSDILNRFLLERR